MSRSDIVASPWNEGIAMYQNGSLMKLVMNAWDVIVNLLSADGVIM